MAKGQIIPCTREEMDNLISKSIEDEFSYLLFSFARKTGRRLGEIYNIKVKDINFEKKILFADVLKRRIKVKREVILDDSLIYLLKRYISQNKMKLEDYLFRKVTTRQIQNLVKRYAKKAEISHNVCFHNFRHFFVTSLIKAGWSYDKIVKLTGHANPSTLIHYDHVVATDIEMDAREAIGRI